MITLQCLFFTHPPTLALATCSGSDAKYGEPLEACSSFCRVHMTPGPINAGETALTRIPWGAKSYVPGLIEDLRNFRAVSI